MFEIKNFDTWHEYDGFSEGSGRSEKVWLISDDKTIGLFKYPKIDPVVNGPTTEHVSEHLAHQLGKILGVSTARVDIGTRDGRIGCMSYLVCDSGETLVPEPENDYDPLAIRVVSQDGAHLGYIPRYYNKEILARLNKGMTYSCEVIEIDYDCSTSECIKVRVKMPCDE